MTTIEAPRTELAMSTSDADDGWRVSVHDATGLMLFVNRLQVLADYGHEIRVLGLPSAALCSGRASHAYLWKGTDGPKWRGDVRQGPSDVVGPPDVITVTDVNVVAGLMCTIGTMTFFWKTT